MTDYRVATRNPATEVPCEEGIRASSFNLAVTRVGDATDDDIEALANYLRGPRTQKRYDYALTSPEYEIQKWRRLDLFVTYDRLSTGAFLT